MGKLLTRLGLQRALEVTTVFIVEQLGQWFCYRRDATLRQEDVLTCSTLLI